MPQQGERDLSNERHSEDSNVERTSNKPATSPKRSGSDSAAGLIR
jgi:hypothetical protein